MTDITQRGSETEGGESTERPGYCVKVKRNHMVSSIAPPNVTVQKVRKNHRVWSWMTSKKKKDSQTTHTPTVHTELSHTRLDIVGGLQWTGVRQSAAVAGESHCKHTLGYGAAPGPWQTSDEGTHTLICVFKHSPAQTVGHQRSGALPCLTICQSPSHSQPTHKSTDRCFSYSGIKKSPEQQWDFPLIHLSWEATL